MSGRNQQLLRYKDLPVPRLFKRTSSYWFSIYESVMDTTDPYILKSCMFYHLAEEIENDKFMMEMLSARDYSAIRSYFITNW